MSKNDWLQDYSDGGAFYASYKEMTRSQKEHAKKVHEEIHSRTTSSSGSNQSWGSTSSSSAGVSVSPEAAGVIGIGILVLGALYAVFYVIPFILCILFGVALPLFVAYARGLYGHGVLAIIPFEALNFALFGILVVFGILQPFSDHVGGLFAGITLVAIPAVSVVSMLVFYLTRRFLDSSEDGLKRFTCNSLITALLSPIFIYFAMTILVYFDVVSRSWKYVDESWGAKLVIAGTQAKTGIVENFSFFVAGCLLIGVFCAIIKEGEIEAKAPFS